MTLFFFFLQKQYAKIRMTAAATIPVTTMPTRVLEEMEEDDAVAVEGGVGVDAEFGGGGGDSVELGVEGVVGVDVDVGGGGGEGVELELEGGGGGEATADGGVDDRSGGGGDWAPEAGDWAGGGED